MRFVGGLNDSACIGLARVVESQLQVTGKIGWSRSAVIRRIDLEGFLRLDITACEIAVDRIDPIDDVLKVAGRRWRVSGRHYPHQTTAYGARNRAVVRQCWGISLH